MCKVDRVVRCVLLVITVQAQEMGLLIFVLLIVIALQGHLDQLHVQLTTLLLKDRQHQINVFLRQETLVALQAMEPRYQVNHHQILHDVHQEFILMHLTQEVTSVGRVGRCHVRWLSFVEALSIGMGLRVLLVEQQDVEDVPQAFFHHITAVPVITEVRSLPVQLHQMIVINNLCHGVLDAQEQSMRHLMVTQTQ